MKAVLTLCLCVILSACTLPISTPFDGQTQKQIIPQSPALQAELDALAIPFLDSIQADSISQRREVCGYFFRHPEGDIRVTPPAAGTFATCELPRLGTDAGIVANYHTHGAFGVSYDNEVPSVNDFEAAQQLGMNGYLSTPGGRVWRIDVASGIATQLCGLGCVTSDPNFVPRNESGVLQRYSLMQIARRNGQ